MRQSLMQAFDDIYILDLHGNSKKKERAPDDSKDENVFDIQQGVAVGIFVKRRSKRDEEHELLIRRLEHLEKAHPRDERRGTVEPPELTEEDDETLTHAWAEVAEEQKAAEAMKRANVHHAHLWGVRETFTEDVSGERELTGGKYLWLWQNDISTTEWTMLEPQSPFYLFVPQDVGLREDYEANWKLTDMMSVNNTGIITSRDKFVRDFDTDEVLKRISDFRNLDFEVAKEKYGLGDVRERTLLESWKMVREMKDIKAHIAHVLWQPFDFRKLFYHHSLVRWPVYAIMHHMTAGENIGIITTRSIEIGRGWEHILCTSKMVQHHAVSNKEVNYLFPLYLYATERTSLYDEPPTDAPGGRRPNLSEKFIADFAARLKMRFVADGKGDREEAFGPEDVFSYMYAVFHSPTYRTRYAEFLKIDFPRLPLTSRPELFRALCRIGDELVGLHLLDNVPSSSATYPESGTNEVEQVRYTAPGEAGASVGRVWINREQYFAGVHAEVWNFHVGGYQVASKWLKDRRGRKLTYEEIEHYRQIIAALAETIHLMPEIDAEIERHGGWPLK